MAAKSREGKITLGIRVGFVALSATKLMTKRNFEESV